MSIQIPTLRKFYQCFFIMLIIPFYTSAQTKPPTIIFSAEVKENGVSKYEIYNAAGKKLFDKPVDWAWSNTWSWIFVTDRSSKLKTVYNWNGEPFNIDSVQSHRSTYTNLNRVGIQKNNKWGFYDKQGKLRIPHMFDEISNFYINRAAVKTGGEIYLIDTNGVRVDQAYNPNDEHQSFEGMDIAVGMGGDFYDHEYKKVTENGKVGLIDTANRVVVPIEYDMLCGMKKSFRLICVGKNKKHGIVAFGGGIVIPIIYESVFVLNDYF